MKLLKLVADDREVASVRPYLRKEAALLCLDCDALFESSGEQRCPACSGSEAIPAARALDRPSTRDALAKLLKAIAGCYVERSPELVDAENEASGLLTSITDRQPVEEVTGA